MNKTFLVGRLTKDPELNYTKSELAICNFTVAVNRSFTNAQGEREADFINVVVYRKQAENVKKYCAKGSLVGIDGRIQTRNYDNQEGKKVYVTEVVADNVTFLSNKKDGQAGITPQEVEREVQNNKMPDEPFADFGETIELSEEDIAF